MDSSATPGPDDPLILKEQDNHISSDIWDGKVMDFSLVGGLVSDIVSILLPSKYTDETLALALFGSFVCVKYCLTVVY